MITETSSRRIGKAIVAGFMATVAVTLLLLAKHTLHIMPEMPLIRMLATFLGSPDNRQVGWIANFVIGTLVWGALFGWLVPYLTGRIWLRGIEFALVTWLLMMLVEMPKLGVGYFGMNLGMMAPVLTLVLHIAFGAVLGCVYGTFLNGGARTPEDGSHQHHGHPI